MYKDNEKLKLLADFKKPEDKGHLPKGTEVTFIKAIDYEFKSYVVVQHGDRILTMPELALAPVETDPLKALKDFNNALMDSNPELRKYHHNIIMRAFYRIRDFFRKLLTKKKEQVKIEPDLSDLKSIINEGGNVEWV